MIFGRLVKSKGVTTIMVGEIPYGVSTTGFGIEEFVADGVILLKYVRTGNVEKKELEITKMRGVPIERSAYEYLIDKAYGGIGVIALPPRTTIELAPRERLSTGVEGLDKMMEGGVYRHSVTLVEGAGGIGKTTLCLQFLFKNAEKGEKSLYMSFEEPVGQIKRMLENYGLDYKG